MKKISLSLLCLAGFVHAQTIQDLNATSIQSLNALSAFSNEVNAGSARYIGMGGSMGALGGDISSTEQNPAGLAVAITSDINATLSLNNYKNDATFGSKFSTKDNSVRFQNLGATFVFTDESSKWNRFSIGIKYSEELLDNHLRLGRNNQVNATYLTNEDPVEYTSYTFAGYQDAVEGYKTKVGLNFGASYTDRIYLGLGFNFHEVRTDNYVVFDEDTEGTTFRYDLNGTPYFNRAVGFSMSAGAIGKVNDQVRLGLAYHSPVWYSDIEESFYANLPSGNDSYTYDFYYNEYDRNSNGRLVASAGMVVGKSLALNADYTLHMNGSTKLKPNRYFSEMNQYLDNNFKSSSEVRLGGEFRKDNFRLRAGYNWVQSPFEDANLKADLGNGTPITGNFSDLIRGDINRYSFGAGYDFGGFYLDAAYQFQNQKYNTIFGKGDYVDYDSGNVYYASLPLYSDHNYLAKVKSNRGMFLLTAGWQF